MDVLERRSAVQNRRAAWIPLDGWHTGSVDIPVHEAHLELLQYLAHRAVAKEVVLLHRVLDAVVQLALTLGRAMYL